MVKILKCTALGSTAHHLSHFVSSPWDMSLGGCTNWGFLNKNNSHGSSVE